MGVGCKLCGRKYRSFLFNAIVRVQTLSNAVVCVFLFTDDAGYTTKHPLKEEF